MQEDLERESCKRNEKKFSPTHVVSRASRFLKQLNQDTSCVQVDKSKTKYCVCQVPNDGNIYIECSSCQQWYHPKCINYNVVHDHAILNQNYKCGYCANLKSWPSRRPSVANITSIRPAVLHESGAIRGRRGQEQYDELRANLLLASFHVDYLPGRGGFWANPDADKTCFSCNRLCVGEIVNGEIWCNRCADYYYS